MLLIVARVTKCNQIVRMVAAEFIYRNYVVYVKFNIFSKFRAYFALIAILFFNIGP